MIFHPSTSRGGREITAVEEKGTCRKISVGAAALAQRSLLPALPPERGIKKKIVKGRMGRKRRVGETSPGTGGGGPKKRSSCRSPVCTFLFSGDPSQFLHWE